MRLTVEEYKRFQQTGKLPGQEEKKKSKYRNKKTIVDGVAFDSKLEASHYKKIQLMAKAGEVLCFSRQVSFKLAGGVTYRADFLLTYPNGRNVVVDSKGVETQAFKIKWKQVKELYPDFDFEIWKT